MAEQNSKVNPRPHYVRNVTNQTIADMDRYEEALKKAREARRNTESAVTISILESVFPELKESEDERIKKAISQCIEDMRGQFEKLYSVHHKDAIAWLEKQGEQNLTDVRTIGYWHVEDVEQKPAWSEEDEYYYGIVQYILNNECVGKADKENASNWFKSIKDRVQPQPKQEWSEEDDKNLEKTIWYVEKGGKLIFAKTDELVSWLKSLRIRNKWKPSEGQLECLGYAIEKAEKDWSPLTNNRVYLTLKALKEQLLELRGSKV